MYKIKHIKAACLTLIWLIMLTACKKFIEVDPPRTRLTKSTVFENDETAKSVLADVYSKVHGHNLIGISWFAALSADEVNTANFAEYEQFNQNLISPLNNQLLEEWNGGYTAIYAANALIEGLNSSVRVSETTKSQLTAEAKFLRAFTHYNLSALFGDIPYITITDYRENGMVSRKPVAEVRELIVNDLKEAQKNLLNDFSTFGNERIRATTWTATSLLARIYLYQKNYAMAEAEADKVISSPLFQLKTDLNDVFLKNSNEAIWQLMPGTNSNYPGESFLFNRPSDSPDATRLQNTLLNAFESGDLRRIKWVGTGEGNSGYFPWKYKSTLASTAVTEYTVMFRLAELYLIRAEARIKQGKLTGANSGQSDINVIRARAGLSGTTANAESTLLAAVEQERRIELFTEWGDRWLYLKHSGKIDAVLGAIKPEWKSTASLYPIPNAELLLNPNLKQNPGY